MLNLCYALLCHRKMDSKPSTSSEPDISDLIELLAPIADKCIIFGSLIKVEHNVLARIDKDNNDSMNKLYCILEYRLDQEPPLTWHDIVRALKSAAICKLNLASNIESQYISPCQQQQPSSGESLSTQANSASSSGALLKVSESEGSLAHVVSSGAGNVVNPTHEISEYVLLHTQQSQFQHHPMHNTVLVSGPHQPNLPTPPSQASNNNLCSQQAIHMPINLHQCVIHGFLRWPTRGQGQYNLEVSNRPVAHFIPHKQWVI